LASKTPLALLALPVLLLFCARERGRPVPAAALATEAAVRGRAVPVSQDQTGEALLQIAENARETLPDFFRRLFRAAKNESGFRIKCPFRADSGSGFSTEQLWLSDIGFRDGTYYGILDSTPLHIAGMRRGDTISFSADEITDWMYIRRGKIIGGHSIKYLLEQIPEEQRNEEQRGILAMFDHK
jgi:uncharacterized protein YegJ (DUF2314 family)